MRNQKLGLFVPLLVLSALAGGCSFERSSSNVLAPSSTSSPAADNKTLVGTWTSQDTQPALPNPSTCGNFQYQVTSQTASSIAGTFSGVCGGGVTIAGSASGQLNGTAVTITATGSGSLTGIPNCPFSITGNGSIIDNGNTLNLPFSGTTCLGPVQGTEVLHKPSTPVVLQPPGPVEPVNGAVIAVLHPTLVFTNAQRSGPAGAITYTVEVATSDSFSNPVQVLTASEQSGQTSVTVTTDLWYSTQYFWRVRAADPTTTGPWSGTQAFQTPAAPAPPPPTPSGDAINLSTAAVYNSPSDIASWPVTTTITRLNMSGSAGLSFEFSKKAGWPEYTPPGWDGGIQYTVWAVVNVNGQWNTSGFIEMWRDRSSTGAPILSDFARNWAYDGRWGPMCGYQPHAGEQMGFFVSAGDARGFGGVTSLRERSNVVVVALPAGDSGSFAFSMGRMFGFR